MSYYSGTFSNASPAIGLITALEIGILAETGLSKVSSAIVVGTNTWNVYKSAAANNSFGQDFHFALGYVTATPTTLLLTVFEGWNTGTLLATKYPPNATTTPDGTFANPGTALALPSTGTTMGYAQSIVLTAGCAYYYTVTADRLIFSVNTSTNLPVGFYIGLYDSFNTTIYDPFPICVINFANSSTAVISSAATTMSGLFTREPNTATLNSTNFSGNAGTGLVNAWTRPDPSILDAYKNFYYVSRVLIIGRSAVANRGLLKDVYMGPTQTTNGDTITWSVSGSTKVAVRAATGTYGNYFLTI